MSLYSSDTRLSRQRQITTLKVYNETVEEVDETVEDYAFSPHFACRLPQPICQ